MMQRIFFDVDVLNDDENDDGGSRNCMINVTKYKTE